jgi:hypothetical protein
LLNRQPHCGREYLWIVVPERILNEGREADAKKARTLAEAGAVDLLKVAAWAEFFGGLRSGDVAPENPRRDRDRAEGLRRGAAIDGDEAGRRGDDEAVRGEGH